MKSHKAIRLNTPFWSIPEAPTGVYSCIRTSVAVIGLTPSTANKPDVSHWTAADASAVEVGSGNIRIFPTPTSG